MTFAFQRANMRIGKITNNVEYYRNEQNQNCKFLESNFAFPNWKTIQEFPKFYNFENHKISIIDKLIK